MCNLKSKSKKRTVTVYKVVYKVLIDNEVQYRSVFAFTKIQPGKVHAQQQDDYETGMRFSNEFHYYTRGSLFFNSLAIGKTTGFRDKHIAERFYASLPKCNIKASEKVMLEIKLGGEIAIGDSERVSYYIPDDGIMYAGSEILSMKEVEVKVPKSI